MRTRIKDIAERVGVSTALVSMYLNHHPLSARMAEKTKRRIDEAVREMNYQPSAAARSLKKGKSRTLGLVIGDIASVYSGFYSQMLLLCTIKRKSRNACGTSSTASRTGFSIRWNWIRMRMRRFRSICRTIRFC